MVNHEKHCCGCERQDREDINMNKADLELDRVDKVEELKAIYKELFDIVIDEENANLSFKKLGIDSLQVVSILVEIEEKIGFDFYDSGADLMKLRTFNDLIHIMQE